MAGRSLRSAGMAPDRVSAGGRADLAHPNVVWRESQNGRAGSRPMAPESADLNQLGRLLVDLYLRRSGSPRSAPIVSIVKDRADGSTPLADLGKWLETAQPHPVPHVVEDLQAPGELGPPPAERDNLLPDIGTADVELIKDHLRRLATKLGTSTGGSYTFPHLDLVTALMTVRLRELPPRRLRELRVAIHRRSSIDATVNTGRTLLEAANPLLRLLLLLPPLWIRICSSGRFPFLGGVPFRWLLTQPHIVRDDQNRSLLGVAERLTDGLWQNEAPDQVARVLVDAFLADLRRGFRPRWFRRYRTTYPVVMLRNVTRANGGYPLLRMVNEVRNATGRNDPLVLWSESRLIPPFATEPDDVRARQDTDLLSRVEEWRRTYPRLRRRRDDRTWFMVVRLARVPDGTPVLDVRPERPGVPWPRSQAAAALLAAVVLLVPIGAYAVHSVAHCGSGYSWPGLAPTTRYQWGTDECIGVSDDLFDFVPGDSQAFFQPVRDAMRTHNQEAVRRARTSGRPLVTVAYAAAQPRDLPVPARSAEREGLAGIVVAQERQLELTDPREPLVRALVANGGDDMAYGSATAALLRDVSRADPTFVGVVGLNESRDHTVEFLHDLAGYGIPTVAAPLSLDRLADDNPLYFQIAPQNRRESDVLAARMVDLTTRPERRGRSTASRIYVTTDPTDAYAHNLAEDLQVSLRDRGLPSESPVPAPNWHAAGREACDVPGFVVFVGRWCRSSRAPRGRGQPMPRRPADDPRRRRPSQVRRRHRAQEEQRRAVHLRELRSGAESRDQKVYGNYLFGEGLLHLLHRPVPLRRHARGRVPRRARHPHLRRDGHGRRRRAEPDPADRGHPGHAAVAVGEPPRDPRTTRSRGPAARSTSKARPRAVSPCARRSTSSTSATATSTPARSCSAACAAAASRPTGARPEYAAWARRAPEAVSRGRAARPGATGTHDVDRRR